MTAQRQFQRKIGYLIAIGVLIGFLYYLGHPATPPSKNDPGPPAGCWRKTVRATGSAKPRSARSI